MLTIFIENKDGKIRQVLWQLNDAVENDEQKWMEARVQIKGSELSNDNIYKVIIIWSTFQKKNI